MNKERLIKIINESKASQELKTTVLAYVEEAYTAGFIDGLKRGGEIQAQAFDTLVRGKSV